MSTDSLKRSLGDRWRSFQIGARVRGALRPIPSMVSLGLIALTVVVSFELLPAAVSDITLSVRARTEVLEIELDPAREFVWWLPAGTYSLVSGDQQGQQCRQRAQFDVVCDAGTKTALVVRNGATVRLETIPASEDARGDGATVYSRHRTSRAGAFSRPRTGRDHEGLRLGAVSLRDSHARRRNRGARSHDLVTFESSDFDRGESR